jgi:hypothetical protein
VLTAVAIIPSAPVLVPELAGTAAAEIADLTAAVRSAAAALPPRWIGVGVDTVARRVGPQAAGTFAGYGADVRVALSPGAQETADLPLCALMTAWARGLVAPRAQAETYCYPASLAADTAVAQGRTLRAEIDGAAEPVGVLVVADGCHTLAPPAPGGYDPAAQAVQAALDDALAAGDVTALTELPAGVVGRAAFGVLAGLAGNGPAAARELYRGAPYGVGYFVGVWQP